MMEKEGARKFRDRKKTQILDRERKSRAVQKEEAGGGRNS